jgi:hypothetical protein
VIDVPELWYGTPHRKGRVLEADPEGGYWVHTVGDDPHVKTLPDDAVRLVALAERPAAPDLVSAMFDVLENTVRDRGATPTHEYADVEAMAAVAARHTADAVAAERARIREALARKADPKRRAERPAAPDWCDATTNTGQVCGGRIDPEHEVCENEDDHHGIAGTEPYAPALVTSEDEGARWWGYDSAEHQRAVLDEHYAERPAEPDQDPDLVAAFMSTAIVQMHQKARGGFRRPSRHEANRMAAVAARHTADALAAQRDRERPAEPGPDPDLVEAFRSARLTKPEAERLAAVAARHTADALAAERARIRGQLRTIAAWIESEARVTGRESTATLAAKVRGMADRASAVVDRDTGGQR